MLSHGLVTGLFWFSFIIDLITPDITPFCNFKIGA
jgi:hypothetical protein